MIRPLYIRFLLIALLVSGVIYTAKAENARTTDVNEDAFYLGLKAFDGGDYQSVVAYWRPLAIAGHTEVQIALADLYDRGLLGRADPLEATRWYRAAATKGHPLAFIALGERAEKGQLTPNVLAGKTGQGRDNQAYYWFRKAALTGNAFAKKKADFWAGRLPSGLKREIDAKATLEQMNK